MPIIRNIWKCIYNLTGHPADLLDKNHPDWVPCKNLRLNEGFALKSKSAVDRYNRSKERVRNLVLRWIVSQSICKNKISNFIFI